MTQTRSFLRLKTKLIFMSKFLDKLVKKLEGISENTLQDRSPLETEDVWVTTGIPELDFNLGCFGLKKGIVELAGESMAGKTTLGLTVVGNFLRQYEEAICIYAQSEERIDDAYAARLGVNNKRVFKVKSKFVEDLFFRIQSHIDEIENTWREEKLSGKPKIIILWDSIQATNSRAELDTFKENTKNFENSLKNSKKFELKHAKMADFQKAAKTCVKAIFSQLYEKDIIMICLNHLVDNLNSSFGGKTSTGGSWREYFSWLRLEMQIDKIATSKMKIDGQKWGQITKIKVVKNDFGQYENTVVRICIGYGFMLTENDIDFAVKNEIVKKLSETKYSFLNGKLEWNSPRTFMNLYRNQNKLLKVLHSKIIDLRHKQILK